MRKIDSSVRLSAVLGAALSLLMIAGTALAQQDRSELAEAQPATIAEEATARPACVRVTGSRLCQRVERLQDEPSPGASPVSVYGRDDILFTGHTNAGDALRQLDPRLW